MKTAMITGAAVLVAAGTATVAIETIHSMRAQTDIQGAWEGIVATKPGAKLRVVLKVAKTDSVYRATVDSIDQRSKDIPVTKFDYRHPAVRFEMNTVGGTYEGTLNSSNTELSGTWKQLEFGLDTPLVLKRTTTPTTIPRLLTEGDYAPRAGSDLQGYWKGAVKIGTGSLPVAFKFSEPTKGKFLAEMDSPTQGANALVVSAITYDKPTVRLEISLVDGIFKGDLANDGTEIKGTWSQSGQTLPLTIKRTDPQAERAQAAALEAQKDYSYTSPDDLTGHWKGALDIKGAKLRLTLHVAKLPDGKLSGTLKSLDQGGNDIPATTVRFTTPTAHLEWPAIAGSYDGKLENGKLSGTWRQGGAEFPLAFERDAAK